MRSKAGSKIIICIGKSQPVHLGTSGYCKPLVSLTGIEPDVLIYIAWSATSMWEGIGFLAFGRTFS